ncbi:TipAS antibiotic-recognition domain-containing protein [Streptomyces sp. NPDC018019]|uniref:TipAS antibiotic-recognition domain-containing protein n=1 Tax=Streptomyces sp. NPDC018019 TaxID=3365030 RepID=UPI0037B27623
MIRPAGLLASGASAGSAPVQAEIDTQYRVLTRVRTVSAEEYRAIGRSCVENAYWYAAYESIAPGLAGYQRDALETYVATRLS